MAQQLKLPDFGAKRSKDFPDYLLMYCPRDDCPSWPGNGEEQMPFLADARTMRRPLRRVAHGSNKPFTIAARPCPYCFRSAYVPKRDTIR